MVGLEPTGHYWFTLAAHLQGGDFKLVLVNPYHVKRSKELDDGHPSKSDKKDPKTIAKLVLEGRYVYPYIPQGLYAELRVAMNCRWRIRKELASIQNQIQRWLKIYFPEHSKVFGRFTGAGSMALLHSAPFPSDLISLGVEGISGIWKQMKLRGIGRKRAQRIYEAAQTSVGCTTGMEAARMELQILLEDYDAELQQYERVMQVVENLCSQIPAVAELLKIQGLGLVTVAGLFAEIGDIRRFESPRQIQKLAGLAITENSSGKHKGPTEISRRGRSRLRAILFRAAIPLLAKNREFQLLHRYYTTRQNNPLQKIQSVIAICCKLLRVFYALATKDCAYSPEKMLADIQRNQPLKAA